MRRSVWLVGVAVALIASVLAVSGPSSAHVGRAQPSSGPRCDPIDPAECLFPFPDNFFTVRDWTSPTGRRVHFTADEMPVNAQGVPVDPTDWNASDGFSPGSLIETFVPGLDLKATGAAPLTDIGRSLDWRAPIVLLDADTGRRVPYWAELDTWNTDQSTRALVIRPARNFLEGHRIIVALRNLKDSSGNAIQPSPAFRALRDGSWSSDPAVAQRRPAMERIFDDLLWEAGIGRRSLFLAWDFTVASEQGLAGRMLHMRDDAYAQLGSGVPAFTVTKVDENPNNNVLRFVDGTFDVPLYLDNGGAPGGRFVLGPDGLPTRQGVYHAAFHCLVPPSTIDLEGHASAARGIVYGHGLLGSTDEINGFGPVANWFRLVICATPEIGMAGEDVGNVVNVINNFSSFGSIPDRLQQGMLNMQFLARLVKDPRGFGSDPAFRVGTDNASAIVANQVFYNGNSQGGIFGGAATAISKEWTRALLGVPGMNYSELLPRSVDFDEFQTFFQPAYPDQRVRTLVVALSQILWDRGEPDGYAQHLTRDPYPGTPVHKVLMIASFGDHQVANISTETEARTIGALVHRPALAPGRSNDVYPVWGVRSAPSGDFDGNVLEIWDFGTPAPPVESFPPESPQYGSDPHGAARGVPAVLNQFSAYLQQNGQFIDVCGDNPCAP